MIYFDNAATAAPDRECIKQAEKYLCEEYFNPSALYKEGFGVQVAIRSAKEKILSLLGGKEFFELTFTSGGTEADNLAVFGVAGRGNVVTTAGEHSAVFASVNELSKRGTEVRIANLNSDGSVNVDHLLSLIDDKTSLVSVIHVNSETGAINDVAEISSKIKAKNKRVVFHSDGVQAFGKIPFKLTTNIDTYSISAHKVGGIKGCGALIKRKNSVLKPLIFGGGQEKGLRSGTENVFGIKCFEYAAAKKYADLKEGLKSVSNLRKNFLDGLDKNLFEIISSNDCSPYIVSVSAAGLRGETLLHEANDRGLIVGTGSACSSNEKNRFSRIILACGLNENVADGVLRISFSTANTLKEVAAAAKILNEIAAHRKSVMG